jgi:VWFA-related protein
MLLSSQRILLLVIFLSVSFSAAVKGQSPTPTPLQTDDTEKIFTEEIKLNVSALDRNGKFVAGVDKEDLVIMEDGRIHQADSIRRIPANILIVLDTGGEMRQAKNFDHTKKTAENLIHALQPEDSVAIMQYHDKVEIIAEWTTNKTEALTILKTKANFGKRSVFFNALETATKFLQKSRLDNRHLVLITDGTDTFNNKTQRDAVMQNLLATDVNVHVISYTQLERADIEPRTKGIATSPSPKAIPAEVAGQMPNGVRDTAVTANILSMNIDRVFLRKMRERKQELIDGEKYLAALSKDTNGEFILPESKEEMLDKPALIARIIDSSYVVTYAPKRALSESEAGEVRIIEVSSRRPNLHVQARRKLVVSSKR